MTFYLCSVHNIGIFYTSCGMCMCCLFLVEFEGALGKVTKCSVTSPRKTLEILKSTHTEEVEVEREMNTQQKRRRLLLILEKVQSFYVCL